MKIAFYSVSRLLVGLVLVIGLGACRTYGGYGSEEALKAQIEEANEQFADQLTRAQNGMERLSRAASENVALQPVVSEYEDAMRQHTAFLAEHREQAERVKVHTGALGRLTSSYRDLNRCLGSILSEQAEVNIRYNEAVAHLVAIRDGLGEDVATHEQGDTGLYQAVPPQYARMSSLTRANSLDAALRAAIP
jgi:hypothetical protein